MMDYARKGWSVKFAGEAFAALAPVDAEPDVRAPLPPRIRASCAPLHLTRGPDARGTLGLSTHGRFLARPAQGRPKASTAPAMAGRLVRQEPGGTFSDS